MVRLLRVACLPALFGARALAEGSAESVAEMCNQESCANVADDSTLLQLKSLQAKESKEDPFGAPTYAQLAQAYAEFVKMPSEELRDLPVLRSPVTLTMGAVELKTPWIGGSFMTRGWNGGIPAPTIRVKPGETLQVLLKNNLGPGPGYEACNLDNAQLGLFMNPDSICDLNTTNLHVHGLHVSPEGDSDNIFKKVAPGNSTKFTIQIPKNHMGGTHWYHPHHHHATAAQAGGGAHGAIIVDDPPGYLPKFVEDMPEKLAFLSLVNVAKMMRLENWGNSRLDAVVWNQTLWKNSLYKNWKWDPLSLVVEEHGNAIKDGAGLKPYVAVNGQFRPKTTIKEGKWYRFRFVLAAIEQRVEVRVDPTAKNQARCEFQLLAKDGVYLNEAPRPIEDIFLVSGSRADVAIRCVCQPSFVFPWATTRPCESHLTYTAIWQPMGLGDTGLAVTVEETTDRMLTLVTESSVAPTPTMDPEIEPFAVRRPCYLADLTKVTVAKENTHSVDLPQLYPMMIKVDGKGYIWGHEQPPALAEIPVGQIQEWHVTGIRYHPLHAHVNPYQITSIFNDPYYHVGDWHDTFFPTGTGFATIRFNIDTFTGKMITHCHLLEHEDNGMMGWFKITGKEGTTWAGAKTYDPTCYNEAFPGAVAPKKPVVWR